MKRLLTLFLLIVSYTLAAEHSVVFVHIGPKIPEYAHDAVSQAHLFNPDTPIYFLGNQKALEEFNDPFATPIPLESLPESMEHRTFTKKFGIKEGLFRLALERFLYLDEFIQEYQLENVFHLEYDNMLYADLETLLPRIKKATPKIGATFDNDMRCIPGFLYISGPEAIRGLACFIQKKARSSIYDMKMLALYKNDTNKKGIDHLPIIHKSYAAENALVSNRGHRAKNPDDYTKNIDDIGGIFDAAAIGQYIGGEYHRKTPGFINESCVFNPSKLTYVWEKDKQGRVIPYALYKDEKRQIFNLHIHCKNLKPFAS